MKVLLAFDKFKGSMTAMEACECAQAVIREMQPDWASETIPLSDGGDGFAEILTKAGNGTLFSLEVPGPCLDPVHAHWGIVRIENLPFSVRMRLNLPKEGKLAVIEMAQSSGLVLVPEPKRNPWHTNTYGTGIVIREAAKEGIDAILIGIGGSATNDLGLGALHALGLRFFDANDKEILSYGNPDTWHIINRIDATAMLKLPPIHVAYDTRTTLLGENGATRVFAVNKGLSPDAVPHMDAVLGEMSENLCSVFNKPLSLREEDGSGAAGGFGLGLHIAYGVHALSGMELIEDWLDLRKKIKNADFLVTGEGIFDESSLSGKVVGQLIQLAYQKACPILVFAGKVRLNDAAKKKHEIFTWQITSDTMPLEQALKETPSLLKTKITDVLSHFFSEAYTQQRFRLHRRIRWTKRILRYMPRKATVDNYPGLKWCGKYIRKFSFLWSFRVSEASRAFYAGWILTWVPLYGLQITAGTVLAFLLRANYPILIGLQLISNPLTVVPMWYLDYEVANTLLQHTAFYDPSYHGAIGSFMKEVFQLGSGKQTFTQFWENIRPFGSFLKYAITCFFLGGAIIGTVCAFISDMLYRFVAFRLSRISKLSKNPLLSRFHFDKNKDK